MTNIIWPVGAQMRVGHHISTAVLETAITRNSKRMFTVWWRLWIKGLAFSVCYIWKILCFFNPHTRICFYRFERERGRGREKEKKSMWETSMWNRNIYPLPSLGTPTRDQTCNLLVYGTTLQPTERPSPGESIIYKMIISIIVFFF